MDAPDKLTKLSENLFNTSSDFWTRHQLASEDIPEWLKIMFCL